MSQPDLIVLCAGGHARVVIDVLRRAGRSVAAVLDADTALHGKSLDGVPIIGNDDILRDRLPSSVTLVNALGNRAGAGTSGLKARQSLFARFKAADFSFATVVAPDAMVSPDARLDEGCHIITGAIVHPGAVIGANAIINTGAQVDHDCRIGAHSHIAPGAVLCGSITVGELVHIGAGAVIVPGLSIGDGAVVGAGAVVTKNVAAGATVMGCPAVPQDLQVAR